MQGLAKFPPVELQVRVDEEASQIFQIGIRFGTENLKEAQFADAPLA